MQAPSRWRRSGERNPALLQMCGAWGGTQTSGRDRRYEGQIVIEDGRGASWEGGEGLRPVRQKEAEMKLFRTGRRGRRVAAMLAVGVVAGGSASMPSARAANSDPIVIDANNTTGGGPPFCGVPDCTTLLTDEISAFPYSSFRVHSTFVDGTLGDQAGYALTGESDDGTGVFGLAHGNDPAMVARNDSGPGDKGAGLYVASAFGDGIYSTTKGNNLSGVYGENLGGLGYGVVGRTNSSERPAVWGDNTGGGDGVQGFTGGSGSSAVFGKNTGGGKGVFGSSASGNGVEGGSTSANGVQGESASNTASGVYGQNSATGYGVAGRANAGIGTLGDSANGIGVWANSQNALALKVSGKTQLSRSGVATVAGTASAPQNSVRVSIPITAKSMMTATLQNYVPGVFVVAAVPNVAGGYFTIYLNKKVSTTVGPISWIVTERP
jgi:hypothetical protein